MDIDDDDEVPELTTLDEHLSNHVEKQLTGLSGPVEEELRLEEGERKDAVPITLLTGNLAASSSLLTFRISRIWKDHTIELHP
jgi:hypothetical protein